MTKIFLKTKQKDSKKSATMLKLLNYVKMRGKEYVVEFVQAMLLVRISHPADVSVEFPTISLIENGLKKRKYPARSSSLGEDALLMPEVRG